MNRLPIFTRRSGRALIKVILPLSVASASLFGSPTLAQAPAATSCDRPCLEQLLDTYLAAMARNAPQDLARTATARYTENGQEMPLGDGIWQTASGLGQYRVTAADPQTGQIGFLGVVIENGTPAILGLRLKHEGGRISEAEAVVGRSKEGAEKLEALGKPDPLFLAAVPAARRASRDELIHAANLYFVGLQGGDPAKAPPFTADCERIENGTRTTNNAELAAQSTRDFTYVQLGCTDQFKTGYLKIVTEVRERRFPIVDEERQLVYTFAFLDHAGNVKSVKLTDGREVKVGLLAPFTWEMAELFRVEGGKLRRIEAVLNSAPYKMKSGWGGAMFGNPARD